MVDWKDYIERDPRVMLAVDFVLERLAQGATPEELIENFEGLSSDHIKAAFAYAASALRHEELVAAG
jgi:uncharacterized protein (DUF433 family)